MMMDMKLLPVFIAISVPKLMYKGNFQFQTVTYWLLLNVVFKPLNASAALI